MALKEHPFTAVVRHSLLVNGSFIPAIIKVPATPAQVERAYGGAKTYGVGVQDRGTG
jgi:hypothetical protein